MNEKRRSIAEDLLHHNGWRSTAGLCLQLAEGRISSSTGEKGGFRILEGRLEERDACDNLVIGESVHALSSQKMSLLHSGG